MAYSSNLVLFLALAGIAEALQLSGTRAIRVAQPLAPSRFAHPRCQFGGGGDEPKGLSRDSEPEEFFSTNMGECRPSTPHRRFERRPQGTFSSHPHPSSQMTSPTWRSSAAPW